jgi:uncharacterized protein (DUF1330 family)
MGEQVIPDKATTRQSPTRRALFLVCLDRNSSGTHCAIVSTGGALVQFGPVVYGNVIRWRSRTMTAYVVFIRERMRDRTEYEVYREKSRPVNASHPLKPLALYGQHEVLEGPAIEGAVILEFPSIEAAKAYYHSAAYQDAARHRFLGADYRVFIVEGLQQTK